MARKYVVTGAASGIGKALAEQLTSEGHTVIGVDLKGTDVNVDLSTPAGRAEVVTKVTELSGGSIDAIVPVAGLLAPIPATVAVNYFGMIATLEGLRPLLAGSPAPRAALVTSLAVTDPVDDELHAALLENDEPKALKIAQAIADKTVDNNQNNLIYNSSKHAIAIWVRHNAPSPDWAGNGIPVNAVGPGVIETPMIAAILSTPEGMAAVKAGAPSPLNGPTAPASAPAKLLAWLVSEENTHTTGQVIFIDGGAEAIRRPHKA